MKRTFLILILGVAIATTIAFFVFSRPVEAPLPQDSKKILPQEEAILRIGELEIPVEIADTNETRSQGLSGRPSLSQNRGMLFVFEKPGLYPFWMPDMNFPIDFIWIGSDRRVVGVTRNVPPLRDKSRPIWYYPPSPVQYVLEVNAGFAAAHDIATSDIVVFSNI